MALLLMAGIAGLILYGPIYLEKVVIPDLARRMGVDSVEVEIRRIGLTGADIGLLRLCGDGAETLTIETVRADYTLFGLISRRIDRIEVGAPTLHLTVHEGRISPRGLPLPEAPVSSADRPGRASAPDLPIHLGRLDIRKANLVVHHKDGRFSLPFDLTVTSGKDHPDTFEAHLAAEILGAPINLRTDLSLRQNRLAVRADLGPLRLGRLVDLASRPAGLHLSGDLSATSEAHLTLFPVSLQSLSAELTAHLDAGRMAGVRLRPTDSTSGPVRLRLTGNPDDGLDLMVQSIGLAEPLAAVLDETSVRLRPTPAGDWAADGRVAARLLPADAGDTVPLSPGSPLPLAVEWSGWREAAGRWAVSLSSVSPPDGPGRLTFSGNGVRIEAGQPTLRLSGEGEGRVGTFSGSFGLPKIDFRAGAVTGTADRLAVEGTVRLRPGPVTAAGTARLDGGKVAAGDLGVSASPVSVMLPLRWPVASEGPTPEGTLSVGAIRWGERSLGGVNGRIHPDPSGLKLSATHRSRLIPGLRLGVETTARFFGEPPAFTAEVSARRAADAPEIDLEVLGVPGFRVGGGLSATVDLEMGPAGRRGELSVSMTDGLIRADEGDLAVTGIDLSARMPDLFRGVTAPAQTLAFDRAGVGDLEVTDGRIRYQVEPGGTILVESLTGRWAGGTIGTGAFRISTREAADELGVTIYCDRLNLATVLRQLGVAVADGEGSVNGKVPVRLREGRLIFDDGFLYSTPGKGGTIHVRGAEMITAGGDANTEVALAAEALKDYEYDWATLRLNTEGDDLLMGLSFNGRPAGPLPFVYDRTVGGFIRVSGEAAGSRFQGIRLDVNFRLPLDRLLRYKDIFSRIQ